MKKMRRIFGLLMAMVMVFSLSSMAFASEAQPLSSSTDTEFTITVNPAYSGETYTAYKIFDVTYNDDLSSYAYTIDSSSAWYSTVSSSDLFTLTQISGSNTYVVAVNNGVTGEQIAAALTPVPESEVAAATATPEFEDDADGSTGSGSVTLDVTNSGAGYYFVTTTLGSVVSIDTTSPAVTIKDKNPVPTVTKQVENVSHNGELENNNDVTEGTEDTARVGDIIEFEITISDAAHKSALCLHDYTSKGLSYYGSEHINVYLNGVSAANKVSSDWYTVQDSDCTDGCDFEIVFSAEWLDDLGDTDVIIITYEAVVNEEAVTVNTNDAFVTYGTAGRSVVVETETDVFGLSLEKVDGNGNALDGATFTLAYGDSFGTILSGTLVEFYFDGTTYTVHDAIDEEYAGEETTTNILVGSADIFGLDAGTYTLTETEAPDGYNKLTSPITVIISENGTVTVSGNTQGSDVEGSTITVINNAGSILPGTGGMGTTIFYVIGIIVVAGAAILLITRRRMSHVA